MPNTDEDRADQPSDNAPEAPAAVGGGDGPSRYYIVLFQDGSRHPFGHLSPSVTARIVHKLADVVVTPRESSHVDLWLESPGGSATSAYKLWLAIRHYFCKFRVVIPDYAKSAATLLTIGADEIAMAPAAELGPLDVQIEHPDREHVTISGLDASRALGFLADFAVDYVLAGGQSVLKSTELPRREVLREFTTFTASLLEPLVAKLDPQLVHRAAQDLELATHYALAMLRGRQVDGEYDEPAVNLKALAAHLVEHYPAHEYLISRQEAQGLELPVVYAEKYDKMAQLRSLHRIYDMGIFANNGSNHYIEVCSEEALATIIPKTIDDEGDCNDEIISPQPEAP